MNSRQIELLQASWRHASPIAETVVRLFYRRLFELAPGVRERFCTSMSEQSDHLLAATEELVNNVAGEQPVTGVVSGVDSFTQHEPVVADAWLWALEQEIGRCASEGACDAWREAIRSDAGTTFRLVALGEVALVGV